jgi:hypothetical protein
MTRRFEGLAGVARSSSFAVVVGAVVLLSAAFYNRFPLTFWDTRAYVEHAGTLVPRPDRLIGYSLFILATSLHVSLWPVAIAQCLLVSWLLFVVNRTLFGEGASLRHLAVVVLLTASTALPWIAGQLMPDVFTSLLMLALFVLLEDRALGGVRRTALLGLVALSVSVHLTHFPLGFGVLASFAGAVWFTKGRVSWSRFLAPALALVSGLAGIAAFNFAESGKVSLAAGSDAFLLGHLVDSGIAERMLDEHCPERGYLLCPYRRAFPMTADEFLWDDKLDLDPWHHPAIIAKEAHRLLEDSLVEHPAMHVRVALSYSARQLVTFRTGEGLDADAVPLVEPRIAEFSPVDLPAYRSARQQANAIPVGALRRFHTPVGAAALLLGLAFLAVSRFPNLLSPRLDPAVRFVSVLWTVLVINAVLAGNLSGVTDRYGSRLVWLMVFAMLAIGADALSSGRLGTRR